MDPERKMFAVINRNHDCKALADKLNAISARRHRKKIRLPVCKTGRRQGSVPTLPV